MIFIMSHNSDRYETLKVNQAKLKKLLLNYINFLVGCLNKAETQNEVKRIHDSIKFLEKRLWMQCQPNMEITEASYQNEEKLIYRTIDNLY